jgi:hypothetical protein
MFANLRSSLACDVLFFLHFPIDPNVLFFEFRSGGPFNVSCFAFESKQVQTQASADGVANAANSVKATEAAKAIEAAKAAVAVRATATAAKAEAERREQERVHMVMDAIEAAIAARDRAALEDAVAVAKGMVISVSASDKLQVPLSSDQLVRAPANKPNLLYLFSTPILKAHRCITHVSVPGIAGGGNAHAGVLAVARFETMSRGVVVRRGQRRVRGAGACS